MVSSISDLLLFCFFKSEYLLKSFTVFAFNFLMYTVLHMVLHLFISSGDILLPLLCCLLCLCLPPFLVFLGFLLLFKLFFIIYKYNILFSKSFSKSLKSLKSFPNLLLSFFHQFIQNIYSNHGQSKKIQLYNRIFWQ